MIKTITADDLHALAAKAAQAPRLRANLNLHESLDAAVQRLFIATEPGTYMRPHRHTEAHKWEFFMVVQGRLDLLIFDDAGRVTQRILMAPHTTPAVEIAPDTWHAYVCMQSGTIGLEVKQGAYVPTPERDFAPWSPAENTTGVADYLDWMRQAQPA
jgi:cupin fold WbuC family metalloprotein